MIRFVILGLLRKGESAHGYALVKAYRERIGVQVNSGSFYRELQRLIADRCVQVVDRRPDADPRRRQIEITEAGRRAFDEWFAGHGDCLATARHDELGLRTLFVADVEPAAARQLLQTWRDSLWLHSKRLERERDAAAVRVGEVAGGRAGRASGVTRRLRHVVADLDFLDELRATFDPAGDNGAHTSAAPNGNRATTNRRARRAEARG